MNINKGRETDSSVFNGTDLSTVLSIQQRTEELGRIDWLGPGQGGLYGQFQDLTYKPQGTGNMRKKSDGINNWPSRILFYG